MIAAQVRGDLLLLFLRQFLGVAAHDADVERAIDRIGRHHLQEHQVRRLDDLAQMARGAILPEQGLAGMLC